MLKELYLMCFLVFFFFLKKTSFKEVYSNLLLYEFSCILKFSIQENGNFSSFFFYEYEKACFNFSYAYFVLI